jgi:hypothetical protein
VKKIGLTLGVLVIFLGVAIWQSGLGESFDLLKSGKLTEPVGEVKTVREGMVEGAQHFPQLEEVVSQAISSEEGLNQTKLNGFSERMIIFNRTISLEVEEVEKASSQVEKLAAQYGGYVSSLHFDSKGNGGVSPLEEGKNGLRVPNKGVIVVKVPAQNFQKFSTSLKKLGRLLADFENSEDVTEQYVDLKARLRNLKNEEKRFLEIFQAAKNVQEMLLVEKEVSRLRGEIESLEAQKSQLERLVKLATVTVELEEKEPIVAPAGSSWGTLEAFRQGIRNAVAVINLLIKLSGSLLPLALLTWLIVLVARWFSHRTSAV